MVCQCQISSKYSKQKRYFCIKYQKGKYKCKHWYSVLLDSALLLYWILIQRQEQVKGVWCRNSGVLQLLMALSNPNPVKVLHIGTRVGKGKSFSTSKTTPTTAQSMKAKPSTNRMSLMVELSLLLRVPMLKTDVAPNYRSSCLVSPLPQDITITDSVLLRTYSLPLTTY